MSGNPIIDISNLSYNYPNGVTALKKINLKVYPGEFLAVVGPNGAGKTTLCLHLNSVIPVSMGGEMRGKVEVDGLDTVNHPVHELAEKVGLVLQDPEAQLLSPTVKKEIAFAAENFAIPVDEIRRRMDWALGIVRLKGIEERPLPQLSGGQKQRVAIAAALTLRPKIMVLDEPTSQLDPLGTEEVFSVIRDLNKNLGITIVVVEHKSEYLAEFADRIVVLNKGEKVAEGSPREVFSQADLLHELNIKLPEVTEVGSTLKKKGLVKTLPMTLDEASKLLSSLLADGLLKPTGIEWKKRSEKEEAQGYAVEVEHLTYAYPNEFVALRDINFKIKKGEFVALIGQNGAGKTTLVKNILGLLRSKQGRITVLNKDVSKASVAEIATKVGLVFQNPDYQLFRTSVEEELTFGPKNMGVAPDEIERRLKEALKALNLEQYLKIYPFSLSMGDRRRVTVAAVLAMGPEVLILDEPTTGQDYSGRYEIAEIGKKLNDQGKTIIMITHDMELVAKYASRTIVLGQGEVLLDDSTHNVFARPDVLETTYLKAPQITLLAQRLKSYGLNPGILTLDDMYRSLGVSA